MLEKKAAQGNQYHLQRIKQMLFHYGERSEFQYPEVAHDKVIQPLIIPSHLGEKCGFIVL
jgi:hypothetical protein